MFINVAVGWGAICSQGYPYCPLKGALRSYLGFEPNASGSYEFIVITRSLLQVYLSRLDFLGVVWLPLLREYLLGIGRLTLAPRNIRYAFELVGIVRYADITRVCP